MVSCYYFLALTGQNLDFELQRQLSPSTPPSSTSLFVDEVCVEAQTAYFRNCIRFKVQYLLKISRDGKNETFIQMQAEKHKHTGVYMVLKRCTYF